MAKYYVTCGPPESGIRQVVEAEDELSAAIRAFLRAGYRRAHRKLDPLVGVARRGQQWDTQQSVNDCCFLDTLSVIRCIEQTVEHPKCVLCQRPLGNHE